MLRTVRVTGNGALSPRGLHGDGVWVVGRAFTPGREETYATPACCFTQIGEEEGGVGGGRSAVTAALQAIALIQSQWLTGRKTPSYLLL